MSKIKAVVFDMDGVLIDAKEWHYVALNKALAVFGEKIEREEHLNAFDGLPTKKKLQMLSDRKRLASSVHDAINSLKQKFTKDIIAAECKPIKTQQDSLEKLREQGYKLVVASNSTKDTLVSMITRAGLMQFMDFTMSNQDVINPKPDPEIYNKTIKKLNLQPHEVLILEDNQYGLQAAYASGANVLKINTIEDVNYINIMKCIFSIENSVTSKISSQ